MWNMIKTIDELMAENALIASLDPGFADRELAWYQGRSENELRNEIRSAWNINDGSAYCRARSWLAHRFDDRTYL